MVDSSGMKGDLIGQQIMLKSTSCEDLNIITASTNLRWSVGERSFTSWTGCQSITAIIKTPRTTTHTHLRPIERDYIIYSRCFLSLEGSWSTWRIPMYACMRRICKLRAQRPQLEFEQIIFLLTVATTHDPAPNVMCKKFSTGIKNGY